MPPRDPNVDPTEPYNSYLRSRKVRDDKRWMRPNNFHPPPREGAEESMTGIATPGTQKGAIGTWKGTIGEIKRSSPNWSPSAAGTGPLTHYRPPHYGVGRSGMRRTWERRDRDSLRGRRRSFGTTLASERVPCHVEGPKDPSIFS